MKTFDKESHQQEIVNSRVGHLGGSDSAMVLKVGKKGIKSLSNTDIKRIKVMLGLEERDDFAGNEATKAGHDYEDYIASFSPNISREVRLEGEQYKHFKCIAHADFNNGTEVLECKCVKGDTEYVIKKYYAQFQWYYMLGMTDVYLSHGQVEEQGFKVVQSPFIPKDEETIAMLKKGCELIDEYCEQVLQGNCELSTTEDDMNDELAEMMIEYCSRKSTIDALQAKQDEIKTKIQKYMELHNIATSKSEALGTITYRKGSITQRLNTDKVLTRYPELNTLPDYWKISETKPSITIKTT